MDLQQQQTGLSSTGNPQQLTQPDLVPNPANLQETSSANLNQLQVQGVQVTAQCTTACSGSIPPPQTTVGNAGGVAGSTWVVISVGVVVAAVIAWMFRQLSGRHS